jgi:uncharacterized protein (DUF1778 family)
MTKKRIQVYADEETKRRVELAAAKHRVPVTEYCLTAIEQRLAEDDVLERQQIEIAVKQSDENDLIAKLQALHDDVLRYRDGEPLDVDRHLIAVREERDDELLGLC